MILCNLKGNMAFLSNDGCRPISCRFRDSATYILKLPIENRFQTAADGDMVTIDSL